MALCAENVSGLKRSTDDADFARLGEVVGEHLDYAEG